MSTLVKRSKILNQRRAWLLVVLILPLIFFVVDNFSLEEDNDIYYRSNQPGPSDLAGKWKTNPNQLFYTYLGGETEGYCVQGINSIDGLTSITDVIVAGTSGLPTFSGVQAYNASISPTSYYFTSNNVDRVVDMVKYEDISNNMNLICATRDDSSPIGSGYLEMYKASDGKEIGKNPVWSLDLTGDEYNQPESLCLGDFDGDSSLEVASKSSLGIVNYISNPQSPSGLGLIHNFNL